MCVKTVKMEDTSSPNVVYVPTGTVCFQCTNPNGLVEDAMFSINNETTSSIDGSMVLNGTLVITNSQDIFNAVSSTQIQCKSQRICHQVLVYYDCK